MSIEEQQRRVMQVSLKKKKRGLCKRESKPASKCDWNKYLWKFEHFPSACSQVSLSPRFMNSEN